MIFELRPSFFCRQKLCHKCSLYLGPELSLNCVLRPPVIYDQNHENQRVVVKHRFHYLLVFMGFCYDSPYEGVDLNVGLSKKWITFHFEKFQSAVVGAKTYTTVKTYPPH